MAKTKGVAIDSRVEYSTIYGVADSQICHLIVAHTTMNPCNHSMTFDTNTPVHTRKILMCFTA